jgi:serine protease Do
MSLMQKLPASTRRLRHLGTAMLVAGALIAWQPMPASAASAPDSFSGLAKQVTPAVVNVQTTQMPEQTEQPFNSPFPPGSPFEEFFRQFGPFGGDAEPRGPMNALGSGFVIDSEGHVVTNNHVVDGADEIKIKFADGKEYDATLIGTDPETDLALLKIDSDADVPYVSWGESDALEVGDWVMAVGNPFGLGGTVTAGIVSARGRDIRSGPYDDFIQTDAAINRGNSGGPMFDMSGKVVGVNTAIYSPSGGSVGIGFAIPSSLARTVVASLLQNGTVERGWLGVRIQPVTPEIANAVGLDKDAGALVAGLLPNSPAEGTLRQGDVIVAFDGKPVDEIRDLTRAVAAFPTGKAANVELWRDGTRETVSVEIGARPGQQLAAANSNRQDSSVAAARLGIEVVPLDEQLRARLDLASDSVGVVVMNVDPRGNAARQGIERGDLIRAVNGTDIATPGELNDAIQQTKGDAVLLLITRNGDDHYVGVDLQGA